MTVPKPDFTRLRKVLLREGEPDRVPFYDYFADREIIEAVTGKPFSAETHIQFQLDMGYDYVNAGIRLGYPHRSRHTADTAGLSSGQRYFTDDNQGTIETRADFDAYEWPVVNDAAALAAGIEKTAGMLPDGMKVMLQMPAGVLENVMWLMGYVPMSLAIYDDIDLISDMFERIGSNHVKALEMVMERIDTAQIGAIALADDMGFNHSTMIDPQLLRKYVFPWHKKIVEIAHRYDKPMLLHACGNLESVMEDLIEDVGIDAKQSFEDKIMPVVDFHRKYGRRIAVLGGVDMHVLCTAPEEELRRYVRNILRNCAPGGGYAMGAGNTVANYVPVENYHIMREETIQYGVYPIELG